MAQVREATYSPSPLIKILQDPTLMPTKSMRESLQKPEPIQGGGKRPSHTPSPRREHKPRSPFVAAIAIMEEERQAQHLKSLLRASADRLEQEMRRADDASVRAQYSELREADALSRAKAAEKSKEEMREENIRMERDMRDNLILLEASQRETTRLRSDLAEAHREIEEIQQSERRAQEMLQQYQFAVRDLERQMRQRIAEMQTMVNQCYADGKDDGYDEGYDVGYKEGIKYGRSRLKEETSPQVCQKKKPQKNKN